MIIGLLLKISYCHQAVTKTNNDLSWNKLHSKMSITVLSKSTFSHSRSSHFKYAWSWPFGPRCLVITGSGNALLAVQCWAITCTNINTLRPRQNGLHFPDDIFKWIFLNENVWILINISLKFVPRGPINNIPTLVQVMAWRRPGDKPLSEPMMVRLPTHICVAQAQWVNLSSAIPI